MNRLEKILEIGQELNRIQDLDLLLESILYHARVTASADAGSIYIRRGKELEIKYSNNETLQKKLKKGEKLIYSIFRIPINEKTISGWVAANGQALNIKDMYHIGEKEPYSFNTHFDRVSGYKTISSLTFPLISNHGEVLGVLQLINCKDKKGNVISFSKEEVPFARHFASTATVAIQRTRMTRTLLLRMTKMAEYRDPKETGAHVNRVGSYTCEIYEKWARRRKIDSNEIRRRKDPLRMAAMLHDVGKVGISDTILKKPGRFTPKEFKIMQEHTLLGADLFANRESELDELAREIALNHHERWDGTGYPSGLGGEQIPLYARIVALADVFDALSSARVYKESWTTENVVKEINKSSGTQFDPELVEIFNEILPLLEHIKAKFPE